jgi:hypothetical protein
LAPTKYWRRQNSHVDRVFFRQQNIVVNQILHRKNIGIDKIRCQKNVVVDKKLAQTQKDPLTGGSVESTDADFSQTSLKISYLSLMVLIPLHAVTKCGFASGRPAFMGRLSPVLYRLIVLARHAENTINFGADNISASTDFRQTTAVYISAHRRPIKRW